jgi:transcriptional regulator with XRE-family HTH domain
MDAARVLVTTRKAAGLSQRAVAARAGTSQATLSAYENGRKVPSLPVLERLLRVTGARLAVLPATEAAPVAPGIAAEWARHDRHLVQAIELAEALPYRPAPALGYPRLADAA